MSTIALVHGAWHDGACWDALRPEELAGLLDELIAETEM